MCTISNKDVPGIKFLAGVLIFSTLPLTTLFAQKRLACQDQGIVLHYGDGKDGWRACLAVSKDLRVWAKKGAILSLGAPGTNDSKSASSPWVIKAKGGWHMFYLGTPHTTPAPDRIPAFPYLTLKARSQALGGPGLSGTDRENARYRPDKRPG